MVKKTQKDAMESVKRQSDKFNLSTLNASTKEATERLVGNATTFENTALHSAASKDSLLLHTQSTKALSKFNSQSQLNLLGNASAHKGDTLAAEAEARRLRKETQKLEALEEKATKDQNAGVLTLDQCENLSESYIKSLQKIMLDCSEKG